MSDHDFAARRRESLAVLGRIERQVGPSRLLPRRGRYRLGPMHAVRVGSEDLLATLPTRIGAEPTIEVTAACTSDVVVFGKFDRPGTPRMRAFRSDRQGASALKVQPYRGEDEHGIGREIAARGRVAELAPHISPALLGHGVLETDEGPLGYLHEELVPGAHLRRYDLHEIVEPLVTALTDLYRAAGLDSRPWSEVGATGQLERWDAFVDATPDAEHLRTRVHGLLAADRDVEVSLVHGDPVASNVIVRSDGSVVLVDWEYATEHAIAIDLTKPVQQATEQRESLAIVEKVAGDLVGVRDTSYDLREQLALPQIQMLGWHKEQKAKSKASGRLRRFREVQAQRIELVDLLLG